MKINVTVNICNIKQEKKTINNEKCEPVATE